MELSGHALIFAITSGLWLGTAGTGLLQAKDFRPGSVFKDCVVCPEMVVLPVGSFSMGSLKGHRREQPVQNIIMDKSLAAGRYETTFEEWDACHSAGGCQVQVCKCRCKQGPWGPSPWVPRDPLGSPGVPWDPLGSPGVPWVR